MNRFLTYLIALLICGCGNQKTTSELSGTTEKPIDKLVRNYYEPYEPTEKAIGIIVLGGSEGGINTAMSTASTLSKWGIGSMAVAYFGIKHLPERLKEIPLEYIEQAIVDLKSQPNIDTNCIGILGYSRGAELALLMASKYPELKFAIGFVPAHASFGSYPAYPGFQKSAWTYKGLELPYLPNPTHLNYLKNSSDAIKKQNALRKVKHYSEALIPVENINGPVLLFSGGDDQLWASSWMADQVIARLEEHDHPYDDKHIQFENAGHIFSNSSFSTEFGGTVEENGEAELEAWRILSDFFKEIKTTHNKS